MMLSRMFSVSSNTNIQLNSNNKKEKRRGDAKLDFNKIQVPSKHLLINWLVVFLDIDIDIDLDLDLDLD